jgi:hypothetical protein
VINQVLKGAVVGRIHRSEEWGKLSEDLSLCKDFEPLASVLILILVSSRLLGIYTVNYQSLILLVQSRLSHHFGEKQTLLLGV